MDGKNEKYTKLRVLIGAFLVNVPACLSMLFGNVSTYMYSYFYCRDLPDADSLDPPIMHGLTLVFACISVLAVDAMRYRLGLRVTLAMAVVFCNSAFLLTYFTVQRSAWATAVTFMAVGGVGDGLAVPVSLIYVAGWFEAKSVGLAGSVSCSACGVGAYIFNTLFTAYVNPENLSPDLVRGETSYFTQEAIIERVPTAFAIVGAVSATFQIGGFFLLKQPPPVDDAATREKSRQEDERQWKDDKGCVEGNDVIRGPGGIEIKSYRMDASIGLNGSHCNGMTYASNGHCCAGIKADPELSSSSEIPKAREVKVEVEAVPVGASAAGMSGVCDELKSPVADDRIKTEDDGLLLLEAEQSGKTPRQLLGTETFYLVWFSAFAEALGLLITGTYFKMFGQLWIADDRLLAATGGVSSLMAVVSRPVCGYLIDRLGVKNVLVIHLSSSSFLLALWYLTPMNSKWWFFLWTVVLFMVYYNQFSMYPIVCLKLFGLAHFATNLFLVQSAMTSVMVALPPLLAYLLRASGWFSLFTFGSATALLSCVLLVVRMPS